MGRCDAVVMLPIALRSLPRPGFQRPKIISTLPVDIEGGYAMARKDIFNISGLTTGADDAHILGGPDGQRRPIPAAIMRGPVGAMAEDLRRIAGHIERDLDPALIDPCKYRYRFNPEEGVEALREHIRQHGQRIAILVRPHPEAWGRYQLVYGGRRLAAIRPLGIPVRALVHDLTDEEAAVALGQENAQRVDRTFIEKALFALDLARKGFPPADAMAALGVDRSALSRLETTAQQIPDELIEAIGNAPRVGRRAWSELADRLQDGFRWALEDGEPDAVATDDSLLPSGYKVADSTERNIARDLLRRCLDAANAARASGADSDARFAAVATLVGLASGSVTRSPEKSLVRAKMPVGNVNPSTALALATPESFGDGNGLRGRPAGRAKARVLYDEAGRRLATVRHEADDLYIEVPLAEGRETTGGSGSSDAGFADWLEAHAAAFLRAAYARWLAELKDAGENHGRGRATTASA